LADEKSHQITFKALRDARFCKLLQIHGKRFCKPAIRRKANVGDWIVGLGSKANPTKVDYSGKIVYVMRLTHNWWKTDRKKFARNRAGGMPQWDVFANRRNLGACAEWHMKEDEEDNRFGCT